ncbi:MAG: polyprenol monophosphomannose synthase [Methanoregula sp.]|jgi:dolichol-phosphate mannosyltransferase
MPNKILVFIPTYNERDNVMILYERISNLKLPLDILFVDDNSPDGTGGVLDRINKPDVFVIHRSGKFGIGSAHKEGILWAYSHEYSQLITMDSDFLHRPEDIPAMMEKSNNSEIVIASRFIRKDSLQEWKLWRKFLTISGHFVTRLCLNIPYDVTGAFRLYKIDRIPKILFEKIASKGYSFFPESLNIMDRNGIRISEIPVILPKRTYGESKLKFREMVQWLFFVVALGLRNIRSNEDILPGINRFQ